MISKGTRVTLANDRTFLGTVEQKVRDEDRYLVRSDADVAIGGPQSASHEYDGHELRPLGGGNGPDALKALFTF